MSDAIDRAARIEAEKRHAAGDLYSLEKSRLTTFVEGAEWGVAHLREATQGDATEQAAKVIGDILFADPQIAHEMRGDEPDQIARALAELGLLAPAPLREEWGTRFGDYVVEGRTDADYPFFWKGVPPPGVNVHRYRTDWLPADGISRAEGDGRAEK